MSNIQAPHFHDPDKAREYLEAIRWPDGPVCPHCGSTEGAYALKGKAHRPGLYKCAACRKQFSVTVGTVFERSKVGLDKWLLAAYLLCSSKKGISSHQLHRTLGVTYKTAWFMAHRIREAMREEGGSPMGGPGRIVEVDEVYIGGKRRRPPQTASSKRKLVPGDKKAAKRWGSYGQDKKKVITLVERGGRVRSVHVPNVTSRIVKDEIRRQLHPDTILMTDEAPYYTMVGREMGGHHTVNHSMGEYVRGSVYTNTVEGYFSILKRGLNGIYQHVSRQHLKRYVGEYDFRYNHRALTDAERADEALRGIEGKRLQYRQPVAQGS